MDPSMMDDVANKTAEIAAQWERYFKWEEYYKLHQGEDPQQQQQQQAANTTQAPRQSQQDYQPDHDSDSESDSESVSGSEYDSDESTVYEFSDDEEEPDNNFHVSLEEYDPNLPKLGPDFEQFLDRCRQRIAEQGELAEDASDNDRSKHRMITNHLENMRDDGETAKREHDHRVRLQERAERQREYVEQQEYIKQNPQLDLPQQQEEDESLTKWRQGLREYKERAAKRDREESEDWAAIDRRDMLAERLASRKSAKAERAKAPLKQGEHRPPKKDAQQEERQGHTPLESTPREPASVALAVPPDPGEPAGEPTPCDPTCVPVAVPPDPGEPEGDPEDRQGHTPREPTPREATPRGPASVALAVPPDPGEPTGEPTPCDPSRVPVAVPPDPGESEGEPSPAISHIPPKLNPIGASLKFDGHTVPHSEQRLFLKNTLFPVGSTIHCPCCNSASCDCNFDFFRDDATLGGHVRRSDVDCDPITGPQSLTEPPMMPYNSNIPPKPNAIDVTLKFDGHTVPHKQFFFKKISPRPVRQANSSRGGLVPRSDVNFDPSIGPQRPMKLPKVYYNSNKTMGAKKEYVKDSRKMCFDESTSSSSSSSRSSSSISSSSIDCDGEEDTEDGCGEEEEPTPKRGHAPVLLTMGGTTQPRPVELLQPPKPHKSHLWLDASLATYSKYAMVHVRSMGGGLRVA
jgi:hypothetical protein